MNLESSSALSVVTARLNFVYQPHLFTKPEVCSLAVRQPLRDFWCMFVQPTNGRKALLALSREHDTGKTLGLLLGERQLAALLRNVNIITGVSARLNKS